MANKKNISIQFIRVIAMFMIIFDHILKNVSFPMQSLIVQVANSGVFIFILISGFLYGNKDVSDWKTWFFKRLIRICIPLWIFMIIDFIVEAILWNIFNIKYVFIYAFNLQGILGVNIGGTNLWFLTLIMICYIITPALQWVKKKKISRNIGVVFLIVLVILQAIFAYATDIGMVAGHTLSWCIIAIGMYVAGYFVGNVIFSDKISGIRIIAMTAVSIISSSLVLVFNHICDGKIIYDRIIIYYGMVVVDLWICTIIYKLGQYINNKVLEKIINHLDAISYEFYIVHGLIIAAITNDILLKLGVWEYIISTLVLSYVCATFFHQICKKIYKIKLR
jgi:peptidoglycan/LPS O-acetylase OafA/YrhL